MTDINKEVREGDVAISSRVRLARNFADIPFPPMMNDINAEKVIDTASQAIRSGGNDYLVCHLRDMPKLERLKLMEHHRISPGLLKKTETAAVLLSKDDTVSVMVNEEDHLRIQAILPGLDLTGCARLAGEIDDRIEARADYAFDQNLGYLTTCPTNTGTGLRGSVMLHLPALTMLGQVGPITQAIGKIGLTVRGLYGEGSEAAGCLYQLSNQVTLGRTEEDILASLHATAMQVIDAEREARKSLMANKQLETEDMIMRSWGIFTNARRMDSKEFMKLWSDVRLGVDLGIIKHTDAKTLNALMEEVQPASLITRAGKDAKDIPPHERDALRCDTIREKIGENTHEQ